MDLSHPWNRRLVLGVLGIGLISTGAAYLGLSLFEPPEKVIDKPAITEPITTETTQVPPPSSLVMPQPSVLIPSSSFVVVPVETTSTTTTTTTTTPTTTTTEPLTPACTLLIPLC